MRPARLSFLLAVAALPAAVALAQAPMAVPGAPIVSRVKAGTYTVDSAHTQVLFTVMHLGFNNYFGVFGDVTGTLVLDPARPSAAKLAIEIPMSGISTTSAGLTEHLKKPEFFDAAKFPTASFTSTAVTVRGTTAKITGNLTIKGVTRPVTLDARFIGAGVGPMNKAETVGFEATTTVKRSAFGVSYGIPLVPDEVQLKITAAFEKKS